VPTTDSPASGEASAPRSIVVVGGGLAALRTVAELRQRGYDGHVTVVAAEEGEPYDRPPLSTGLLTSPAPVWLADEGYGSFGELADEVLFGHRARSLDASPGGGPGVRLTAASAAGTVEVRADAAIIATGAEPVVPTGWRGARTLHDLGDADALRHALASSTSFVIVGAGWIGAEVATVAADHGVSVTVLERGPAPLWQAVGADVGSLLLPAYERAGIDLRCEQRVRHVSPGRVETIDHSGEVSVLAADVTLAAVGVRPATGWLAGALPLTVRGALPVDTYGRVLDGPSHVRAVGDCADRHSPRDGIIPGAHWDAALQAPARLAADLLGEEASGPVDPPSYVFSTQLGHNLALLGTPPPLGEREVVLRGDPGAGPWAALYVRDGTLRAALTVDRPRDVGALRKALAAPAYPNVDLAGARDVEVPLRRALRAG